LAETALPIGTLLLAGGVLAALAAGFAGTRAWPWLLIGGLLPLGAAWAEMRRARLPAWEGLPPREVRVQIEIVRTFAPGKDPRKVSGLATVVGTPDHLRDLLGQTLYVSARGRLAFSPPLRSERLDVVGVLQLLPKAPPPNTFDSYLASAGANFTLKRGRFLETVRPPSAYWRACARAEAHLSGLLAFGLESRPGTAGILIAMLLGRSEELSEEQELRFTRSGTLHLFSISGLHIAVIASALTALVGLLRFPAAVGFVLTLGLLWLYVDLTGRPPSAVRAFLMVFLLKTALLAGLPRSTLSFLFVSALVVLAGDPLQLFSASFQMSYGIVAALLLLGLPLAESWETRWALFRSLPPRSWTRLHRGLAWGWRTTLNAAAIGLATLPMSLLLGVWYFSLFTPGAFLANLVLIPLASFALLGGFAAVLAGLAGLPLLTVLFNHAAALILSVVEPALAGFVQAPGVHLPARFDPPGAGALAVIGLLAVLLAGFQMGWTRRWGGAWTPFAYTAAVLIVLVSYGDGP
jgi:competence protein ComEC